jgi:hypothetical protein
MPYTPISAPDTSQIIGENGGELMV